MKNAERWQPGKFIFRKGKLIGSRNRLELAVSSRLNADRVAAMYQKYIPTYVKGRLIDLGCGKVPLFEAYKKYVSDNICVDWANTDHPNAYVDVEADLSTPLPFSDGEFDTIIVSDVLEHIPNPELIWNEMARILKRGGYVLLNVPFFYILHAKPFDYHRYTRYALEFRAKQNNFSVEVLEPLGGAPEVFTDFISKITERIPFIGRPLIMFYQVCCRLFAATNLGRRISAKTSESYPLGYFMVMKKI